MTDNLPTWAREALERAEAATEGPWEWSFAEDGCYGLFSSTCVFSIPYRYRPFDQDREFLSMSRTDVPRLCEALAEALAALEPLAKVAASFGNTVPDGHIVNASLYNLRDEAWRIHPKITVGDARRANEVLTYARD